MENKQPLSSLQVEAKQDAAIASVSKKLIIWSLAAIIVVLVIAGGGYWWYTSQNEKWNDAISAADIEQNDSIRFAKYKEIADAASFKANERAKIIVATRYYEEGKYKEALGYLEKTKAGSDVIQTGVYALQGDCYANLDQLDDALKCFNKALGEADNNPQLVPFVLVKMANIYRVQKNYEKEYEAYSTIRTDYPGFMYDIEKYYQRAKAAAGK